MNREVLERKFPADLIKQRDGNFNQKLDYLEGHTVVARLNEAFNGDWSLEILSHEIMEEEVVVLVRLTAEGVTKSQFGGSRLTRQKETGKLLSLTDDIKSAVTDAIKKAATLYGVGLYLYDKALPDTNQEPQGNSKPAPKSNNITGARVSTKQFSYLQKLAKDQSAAKRELNAFCKQKYGVVADHISRDQASALIDDLVNDRINLLEKTGQAAA